MLIIVALISTEDVALYVFIISSVTLTLASGTFIKSNASFKALTAPLLTDSLVDLRPLTILVNNFVFKTVCERSIFLLKA